MSSAIFLGDVKHRRVEIKQHAFSVPLYMMWVDLNAPESLNEIHPLLGTKGVKALKFNQADYLNRNRDYIQLTIAQRAQAQLKLLGVERDFSHIYMLGQLRCLGFYFSPVNFYFFGNRRDKFDYMVAEVSNTPWNERHYYLVPLNKKVNFNKEFSVSPFMDLAMQYHWHVQQTKNNILIQIANKRDDKLVFNATLRLKKYTLSRSQISALLVRFPAMTWTVMQGIYVQAFKLWIKKVPFLGHANKAK